MPEIDMIAYAEKEGTENEEIIFNIPVFEISKERHDEFQLDVDAIVTSLKDLIKKYQV